MSRRRSASVLDIALGREPMKDPTAQIAGALARQAGRTLEAALADVNAWYDRNGVAAIEKVNPPVEGWGRTLRVGASTVDYTGTVRGAWVEGLVKGIAFDAKSVTGSASFGLDHVGGGKNEAKNRMRLLSQVQYLRGLRDRHRYVAGFLLYCSELETAWWLGGQHLDRLAAGESILIRTKVRATKASPATVTHRLPSLAAPLERAGIPQVGTGRPMLDYLAIAQ